jgi:2-haloacid dehalogenase
MSRPYGIFSDTRSAKPRAGNVGDPHTESTALSKEGAMRFSRKPQWISFDCYGTLIDTRTHYVEIWRELLAQKGVDPGTVLIEYVQAWGGEEFRLIQGPYKRYREILIESVETTLRRHNLPVAVGDGLRLAEAYGTFPPYPDVKPILTTLKERYRLAIISNVDNDIIRQTLAGIGVEFDGVFTAEDCKAYKPSRVPFEHALRGMGVPPQDILHVAFGYQYDHGTASEMGFMTAWVNRRGLVLPPGARKFDVELPDLTGLPALLPS